MELNRIGNVTTWNDASNKLNQNFEKIELAVAGLEEATIKNKGYFISEEALKVSLPTGQVGDRAYVGQRAPYTIYYWDAGTKSWRTDGTFGGDDDVNLGDYYTKQETEAFVDDYHIVLTQDEYESLTTKEDKFYFTYEEE